MGIAARLTNDKLLRLPFPAGLRERGSAGVAAGGRDNETWPTGVAGPTRQCPATVAFYVGRSRGHGACPLRNLHRLAELAGVHGRTPLQSCFSQQYRPEPLVLDLLGVRRPPFTTSSGLVLRVGSNHMCSRPGSEAASLLMPLLPGAGLAAR